MPEETTATFLSRRFFFQRDSASLLRATWFTTFLSDNTTSVNLRTPLCRYNTAVPPSVHGCVLLRHSLGVRRAKLPILCNLAGNLTTVQIKISHSTNKCKKYTAQKFFYNLYHQVSMFSYVLHCTEEAFGFISDCLISENYRFLHKSFRRILLLPVKLSSTREKMPE